MSQYGNHFTYSSSYFYLITEGRNIYDTPYIILDNDTSYNNVYINILSDNQNNYYTTIKNITTYGLDEIPTYYMTTEEGGYFCVYIQHPKNMNTKGSIYGNFYGNLISNEGTKIYLEPDSLDDIDRGYPTNTNTTELLNMSGIELIPTSNTRKYREIYDIYATPVVKYNKNAYNNGIGASYTYYLNGTHLSSFMARQSYCNYPDPKLDIYFNIKNYDNAYSTSPVFCTINTNKISYAINPLNCYIGNGTGKYDTDLLFNFTYNQLPTYPKELRLTSDYTSYISYDGGTVRVEAKAYYNGSYQGFTTSTETDTGFITYKRYVDISYYGTLYNSSTTPAGIPLNENDAYTFRIWQPGSELKLSYNWSVDGNPSYVHLSNNDTNTTIVTIDKQEYIKPKVVGNLKINNTENMTIYYDYNESSTYVTESSTYVYNTYTIGDMIWTLPTQAKKRVINIRQNINIQNCIAQNITPKDSNGNPFKTLNIIQEGTNFEDILPTIRYKLSFLKKDNSTYNDYIDTDSLLRIDMRNAYTRTTSFVSTGEHSLTVNKGNTYCTLDIRLNEKLILSRASSPANNYGSITTKLSNNNLKYPINICALQIKPDLTFCRSYTTGVSERTWLLENIINECNYGECNINTFSDTYIKIKSIPGQYGSYTNDINIELSGYADSSLGDNVDLCFTNKYAYTYNISFSPSNIKSYDVLVLVNNTSYRYKYTNSYWYTRVSDGNYGKIITFSSTTNNIPALQGSIKVKYTSEYDTYKYIKLDIPTNIVTTRPSTYSGTISYKAIISYNSNAYTFTGTVDYPIDGITTYAEINLPNVDNLKEANIIGVGDVQLTVNNASFNKVSALTDSLIISYSGTPSLPSNSYLFITYKLYAISDIVSYYAYNNIYNNLIFEGEDKRNTNIIYKYQYNLNNGEWIDFNNTDSLTTVYIGSNLGTTTIKDSTLVVNNVTDITQGLYDYTPSINYEVGTIDKYHSIGIRVLDLNDTNISYEGRYCVITQSGQQTNISYIPGDYTITMSALGNCTVSPTSETVNYSSDTKNCGKFTATPIYTAYTYYAAYDKINTRGFNTDNANNASASKVGEDKTFPYGTTTISEVYGVSNVTKSFIVEAIGYRSWKISYQYSVQSSNESSPHIQTSVYQGYDEYDSYTANAYISFGNTNNFTLLTDENCTNIATTLDSYIVKVKWAKYSTGTAIKMITYNFNYSALTAIKTEYQITTCSISVNSKSYTAFDSPGSTWSVTANTSVVVQKRTSSDNGSTWTDWASTTDYSTSVSYSGYLSGTGTTASGSMSQGSSDTDGNSKSITFTLKVTCGDNSTTKTATATSTWTWYGKTYYNV